MRAKINEEYKRSLLFADDQIILAEDKDDITYDKKTRGRVQKMGNRDKFIKKHNTRPLEIEKTLKMFNKINKRI